MGSRMRMTLLPTVTRSALALGLVALLAVGLMDRVRWDTPLTVDSGTSASALATALSTARGPGEARELTYRDAVPPTREVSALLTGTAARGDRVTLFVPGSLPELGVTPPRDPVAMRRSSLTLSLRGAPGTTLPVIIDDPSGTADTVSVLFGPYGLVTTAVAVEPTKAGTGRWRVRAGGASETVYAWTRPEARVRALVVSGPPTWESRYLVRALESSGMVVSVHQSLGRDLAVTTEGVAVPRTLSDFDAYDVVAVAGSTDVLSEEVLHQWVAARGGGLLLLGASPTSQPLRAWSTGGTPTPTPDSSINWSAFAELVALPPALLAPNTVGLPQPHPGTPIAWSGGSPDVPNQVYVAAGWMGRGRVYSSGLESWSWAMEAGLVAEHAAYWESVVEWLAGGLREDLALTAQPGVPYVAWTGAFRGRIGAMPQGLTLTRPPRSVGTGRPVDAVSAPTETLQLSVGSDEITVAHFVPLISGDHMLGGDANHGAVVTTENERPSWVRAALQMGHAGAEIRSIASATTTAPQPLGTPAWRRWLNFVCLAGLALAGWTATRLDVHSARGKERPRSSPPRA
jgi:hypothetical protein